MWWTEATRTPPWFPFSPKQPASQLASLQHAAAPAASVRKSMGFATLPTTSNKFTFKLSDFNTHQKKTLGRDQTCQVILSFIPRIPRFSLMDSCQVSWPFHQVEGQKSARFVVQRAISISLQDKCRRRYYVINVIETNQSFFVAQMVL